VKWGATIIASGGTAQALREALIPALSVEDLTGLAPGFGGRVKTLHPNIHAGILARRDVADDLAELERAGARPIDLVYVNLYPFEEAVREGYEEDEKIEKIDVGGPAMLRAAAKNWKSVAALCDPEQIPLVIRELEESGGTLSMETRRALAAAAFARTSAYDRAIARELESGDAVEVRTPSLADQLDVSLEKISDLRYGENPHQRAALYRRLDAPGEGLPRGWKVLGGEELSYNNWVDLAAAGRGCVLSSRSGGGDREAHESCGAATAPTQEEAWEIARAVDPFPHSAALPRSTRRFPPRPPIAWRRCFWRSWWRPVSRIKRWPAWKRSRGSASCRLRRNRFARGAWNGRRSWRTVSCPRRSRTRRRSQRVASGVQARAERRRARRSRVRLGRRRGGEVERDRVRARRPSLGSGRGTDEPG
jgi:hypothetical protein